MSTAPSALPLPSTYVSYHRPPSTSHPYSTTKPFTLQARTLPLPSPSSLGPHQVLLKIISVSLNYRDVAILKGTYVNQAGAIEGGIPCSDAAGVVVAVGEGVRGVGVGERVVTMVGAGFGAWRDGDVGGGQGEEDGVEEEEGEEEVQSLTKSLGAEVDGVLKEYGVFDERSLVPFPEYLGFDEASTLPGAGLTAWTSLRLPHLLSPPSSSSSSSKTSSSKNKSVLLQGTGGVSLFSLLLALAVPNKNLTPIISSSSDEKLTQITALASDGAIKSYNYRTNPDQVSAVQRLTSGRGVDVVVNNTGPASIPADIASLKFGDGRIALVGFLEGLRAEWNPGLLMGLVGKRASLEGILCGTRSDMLALNEFLEERKVDLGPVVDKVFNAVGEKGEDVVREALEWLWEGRQVGKVVIQVSKEE